MNMIKLIAAADNMSVGDAALYALVGFLIVLAVLALLVGIFYLSGFIFKSKALNDGLKKKKDDGAANVAAPAESDDEGALVAAITAAISVILSEESDTDVQPDFVIRRIKKR